MENPFKSITTFEAYTTIAAKKPSWKLDPA